ncbi:heparan-alpha-glucosaminide N-acetyltransferase, partial [Asbolus verrucosus]
MAELSWLEDYGDNDYRGFDMSSLEIDEAYLSINIDNADTDSYRLFTRHTDCIKCPYVTVDQLYPDGVIVDGLRLILKKVPHFLYRITTENVERLGQSDNYICEFGTDFGEFGIYQVNVSKGVCALTTTKKPVSISFPVLTVFLIYCALFLCIYGFVYLWKRFIQNTDKEAPKANETKKRVKSLDTFRGISIVVMIFVNYGAGRYDVLEHAHWNGLHLADLVFPWFMWIMGACVPISLMSSTEDDIRNFQILLNVVIEIRAGSNLGCMRIFGVLQRFGITYLVVTTICLFLMKREITESKVTPPIKIFLMYKVSISAQGWIVVLIIFFVHCMVLFLAADDGCPKGYLGPGGLHDNMQYFNCTGGATGYVDRVILGKHMYPNPTSKEVYRSEQAFDPEGILGCLTSIVHVFIGVQAGMILLVYKEHSARLIRWLSWSVATGVIGGALCGFSKDDGVIPFLFRSISFVLVTSCFAFLLLSLCYVVIDIKNWWSGKPFLFAGMNAIIMYIGHEMTYGHLPMRWTTHCGKDHGTHLIALTENIWGAGFWVVV